MKRNAVTRIIIWSVVLVLLVSILGSVLLLRNYRLHRQSTTEPLLQVTTPYEKPSHAITATITENVNVRTAPSLEASVGFLLLAGDTADITRMETVNGISWAYITSPQQGWVRMEYLRTDNVEETVANVTVPEEAAATGRVLSALEIDWVTGNILIEAADVDDIQISESEVSDSKYVMRVKRNDRKISIEFCEDDLLERGFGISIGENLTKDLTILVPMDWTLNSLEVDAASAALNVRNLVIREVEIDGASGTCDFENCVVDQLDLDTASGDITFSGTLKALDCDAASASVRATLDNVPSRIDMDSMSGDLELTLPDTAGFTLSMDAMSSDFTSDFATTMNNGNYVCGDGSCRINMDGMSGDVYIYKAIAAAAVPEAPLAEESIIQETIASGTTTPIISNHHVHSDACNENPSSCPFNETHHPEP